jgi:hypothetical protein
MKRIKLTRGKHTIVDDDDFERLSKHKWQAVKGGKKLISWRACRSETVNGKKKHIPMSNEIMPPQKGFVVDHKNNDSLDNRKENLRFATLSQNQHNKRKQTGNHRFKGIYFNKRYKIYSASINFNYKARHIGYYKTDVEAAKAYDVVAKELFGEFANLNFKALAEGEKP